MAAAPPDDSGFLSRWSRRKVLVRQGVAPAEPVVAPSVAVVVQHDAQPVGPPQAQARFMVKASFAADPGSDVDGEQLWIEDVSIEGDAIEGRVANDPTYIARLNFGDTVSLSRDDVSDWYYVDNGLLVGGHTLRVFRARMTAEARAKFDAESGFVIND